MRKIKNFIYNGSIGTIEYIRKFKNRIYYGILFDDIISPNSDMRPFTYCLLEWLQISSSELPRIGDKIALNYPGGKKQYGWIITDINKKTNSKKKTAKIIKSIIEFDNSLPVEDCTYERFAQKEKKEGIKLDIPITIITSYDDLVKNVEQYNKDIQKGEKVRDKMSNNSHWYYIPEIDMFGPQKFIFNSNINNQPMDSETFYNVTMWGGDDPLIKSKKWFKIITSELLEKKLYSFCQENGKKPNKKHYIHVPKTYNKSDFTLIDKENLFRNIALLIKNKGEMSNQEIKNNLKQECIKHNIDFNDLIFYDFIKYLEKQ